MAKVTVTICDVCKERIATSQCPICGRDLCKPCTKYLSIELGVKFGPRLEFFRGSMCADCYKKIERNYKQIITRLSTELEPSVLRVLKESVGDITYTPQEVEVKPTTQVTTQTSTYTGGYEPPQRDPDNYAKDVTKAELPEGMDVTRDL